MVEQTILSRYVSLLSQECYNYVMSKSPKDGLAAAKMVQEFEESRGFAGRPQPWQSHSPGQHNLSGPTVSSDFGYRPTPNHGEPGSTSGGSQTSSSYSGRGSSGYSGSNHSGSGYSHGGTPRNSYPPVNASGSQASGGRNVRSEKQGQGGRQPVTCYGCGEPGHIRPNCPNRVRHVGFSGKCSIMLIDGSLAGQPARNLRIDTGAERTVVRQDFVPEDTYTGHSCLLDTWRGSQPSRHRLARITLKVGSVEVFREVAVAESLDCPALLGADLGEEVIVVLMQHVLAASASKKATPLKSSPTQVQTCVPVSSGQSGSVDSSSMPIRTTRAKEANLLAEIEADDVASAQSECQLVDLLQIIDLPDSYFEDDPEPTPVEECSTLPEGSVVEMPLPCLDGNVPDCDSLIAEQQADDTL